LSFLLALDFGNSRIKATLFTGKTIIEQANWKDVSLSTWLTWMADRKLEGVIYAASGKPNDEILTELKSKTKVFLLNASLPLPINIEYDTPMTLGADRIAGSVAAWSFAKDAVLKIDTGTCTTFDVINAEGCFLGGAILPGRKLRAQILHEGSARLPYVEPGWTKVSILGKNTVAALQSGITKGWLHELRGMADEFMQTYDLKHLIISGGDMKLAKTILPEAVERPNLVPEGMIIILEDLLSKNHPTA
jgi:type III pantothenate kinase